MEKKFPAEVESACDNALMLFGFQSRRRGSPLVVINEDFYGWVGLNKSRSADAVRIDPFVGLHCIPVMRLWYELDTDLSKKKYVAGDTATAAVHLGELGPHLNAFVFDPSQGLEDEARRLASAVAEFGLPWMKAHANLDSLLVLLREREETLGGFPERVAIALFLLGRFDELSDYLNRRLEEYARKPAWLQVLESWRRFSDALRERLPT